MWAENLVLTIASQGKASHTARTVRQKKLYRTWLEAVILVKESNDWSVVRYSVFILQFSNNSYFAVVKTQ